MHTGPSTHTSIRRYSAIAIGLAAASVLAGCALVAPAAQPASGSQAGPSAEPTPAAAAPEETCAQLIDINTLLSNEAIAFMQGRIADIEYNSVQQLAGRMVHRVAVAPGTDLAETIDTLKIVVGPYAPSGTSFDATTDQWAAVFSDAQDECTRVGVAFYTEGWTGG